MKTRTPSAFVEEGKKVFKPANKTTQFTMQSDMTQRCLNDQRYQFDWDLEVYTNYFIKGISRLHSNLAPQT